MHAGKLVFAQIAEWLPRSSFQRAVERYRGSYKVQSFSCWDQLLCMMFAQLTYRESLRDIEVCLRSHVRELYHLGIRGRVSRSTLADANRERDWQIFADLAYRLINQARKLYAGDELAVDLENTAYALDSTTIDLCLSMFPWARFRERKAAIKLHTLLDLRGSIPSFIHFTEGKVHDVNAMDHILFEPGAFYVMDRGYLDFARLRRITGALAFFVIRAKTNLKFRRRYSHSTNGVPNILCDQTIVLTGADARRNYPEVMRRIRYFDIETQKELVFLTNSFDLPASSIAALYRCRWQIELFFKWIKQHLRIKAFYGTSENAVKTQVWIAISVYVLIAIIRKRLQLAPSLYTILQILSVNAFQKVPLRELLTMPLDTDLDILDSNQLVFSNL